MDWMFEVLFTNKERWARVSWSHDSTRCGQRGCFRCYYCLGEYLFLIQVAAAIKVWLEVYMEDQNLICKAIDFSNPIFLSNTLFTTHRVVYQTASP